MSEQRERAVCRFRGCDRLVAEGYRGVEVCQVHRDLFDAYTGLEQAELVQSVLKPWVESTKAIGFGLLTLVMDNALSEVEGVISARKAEVERLEAKL